MPSVITQKKQRNSSIELLKIISIILIFITHSVPVYGSGDYVMDVFTETADFTTWMVVWIRHFGQFANVVFIFCSAWFLADSKVTKMEKVFSLILDTFLISMLFLVPYAIAGYDINKTILVENAFSLLYEKNWFVTCYLMLFLLHPALNVACEAIKGKKISNVLFCCLFIYIFCQFFSSGVLYGNRFISFVCVYLFAWYVKNYQSHLCGNVKFNLIMTITCLALVPILLLALNLFALKTGHLSGNIQRFNTTSNPLYMCAAFGCFNLANSRYIYNKFVNYLSSLSLYVYMITENYMVKYFTKPEIFEYIYDTFTYEHILLWVPVITLGTILFGFGLSAIYKESVHRFVEWVSPILCKPLRKGYRKLGKLLFPNA